MNRYILQANHKFKQFRETVSVKDIWGIIFGSFILACSIQILLVPARLLTGGVTGIAIILNFLTSLDVWMWYMLLNIPIFIAGYRFVSKRFALYSLLGILALSFFLAMLQSLNVQSGISDILISAVLGGVFNGIGIGIIMRNKGSSGGTDIIAVIVKRYKGFNFGEVMFAINIIIIGIFAFIENIELAFYSGITIYISSSVIDMVLVGLRVNKSAVIISSKAEDIAAAIIHNINRGCTFLSGQGAYTGINKNIIMVTVGKTQLPRLKEIVFHIDPQAFITINDSIEVYGKGFNTSPNEF